MCGRYRRLCADVCLAYYGHGCPDWPIPHGRLGERAQPSHGGLPTHHRGPPTPSLGHWLKRTLMVWG